MKEDRSIGPELAMSALDEIPEVKSDARDIVGLVKSSGRIIVRWSLFDPA